MLASASPSFLISKIKSSNIFFGVNFDNARPLNLRLMRTLGVERSSEKFCYVLISIHSNILAIEQYTLRRFQRGGGSNWRLS